MDSENKKIRVDDEIWVTDFTDKSALEFREQLLDASKIDPLRPIMVYIHSLGGAVDALASMIETMDEIPNPIITVAHGVAMSCGAILLSCGDMRLCGRHSRIMIHEVSGGTAGDVHDVNADAQEIKRLNRYFMNLLAKNCGIRGGYEALRKLIKNQDGRDAYMDAKKAKKFGIIDGIGLPHVNKASVYQIELLPNKKRIMQRKRQGKKSETRKR